MLATDVTRLASRLPEVVEGAHNGNPDFRLAGRIFATLWLEEERLVVRLTPADIATLDEEAPGLLTPIEGAWGRRGWTNLDLWDADEAFVGRVLLAAWRRLAPALLDDESP